MSYLYACGPVTPEYSNPEVIQLAKEIFEDDFSKQYKEHLQKMSLSANWEKIKSDEQAYNELRDQFLSQKYSHYEPGKTFFYDFVGEGMKIPYSANEYELKDFYDKQNSQLILQIQEGVLNSWDKYASISFNNIRTDEIDDQIKKCKCSAEMDVIISSEGLQEMGLSESDIFRTRTVLFDAQNTEEQLLVWLEFGN